MSIQIQDFQTPDNISLSVDTGTPCSEFYALLGCDTVQSNRYLPTFWRNQLSSLSGPEGLKIKGEGTPRKLATTICEN
jgi:hypothetical protein